MRTVKLSLVRRYDHQYDIDDRDEPKNADSSVNDIMATIMLHTVAGIGTTKGASAPIVPFVRSPAPSSADPLRFVDMLNIGTSTCARLSINGYYTARPESRCSAVSPKPAKENRGVQ